MSEETKTYPTATRTDAVIDTGAALASAGAFGLFGAVIGKAVGSLGSSAHHNTSGKIGAWLGGLTFSILSLYASFRSREQHERVIEGLQDENMRLRVALGGEVPPPVVQPMMAHVPERKVMGVLHEGAAVETAHQQGI